MRLTSLLNSFAIAAFCLIAAFAPSVHAATKPADTPHWVILKHFGAIVDVDKDTSNVVAYATPYGAVVGNPLHTSKHLVLASMFDKDGTAVVASMVAKSPSLHFGLVNRAGKIILDIKYNEIKTSGNGLYTMEIEHYVTQKHGQPELHQKFGIVNSLGKMVVPLGKYTCLGTYHDGLCSYQSTKNKKWGFLSTSGNVVIPPFINRWQSPPPLFHNGLYVINRTGGYPYTTRVVNTKGKTVLSMPAVWMSQFNSGLACVALPKPNQSKWADTILISGYGYINRQGKMVIPPKWARATKFHEGLALVSDQPAPDQPGPTPPTILAVINPAGAVQFKFKAQHAGLFHDGLAAVERHGKCGFLNKQGKMVILPKFDEVNYFKSGYCLVIINNKIFVINRAGKIIFKMPGTYPPID